MVLYMYSPDTDDVTAVNTSMECSLKEKVYPTFRTGICTLFPIQLMFSLPINTLSSSIELETFLLMDCMTSVQYRLSISLEVYCIH